MNPKVIPLTNRSIRNRACENKEMPAGTSIPPRAELRDELYRRLQLVKDYSSSANSNPEITYYICIRTRKF